MIKIIALFLFAFASEVQKRAIVFTLPNEEAMGIPFADESSEIADSFERKGWVTEVITLPNLRPSSAEWTQLQQYITGIDVIQQLQKTSSDKLLVYINGHGNADYGPFFQWEAWGKIINQFATEKAKEIAVFIDSCHSGHLKDHLDLRESSKIKIFSYSACKEYSSRYTAERAFARLLTGEWKSSVMCGPRYIGEEPWNKDDIESMIEDGQLERATDTSVDFDEFNNISSKVNMNKLVQIHAGAMRSQCGIHGKFCRGWHLGKGDSIFAKDWDICPEAVRFEVNLPEGRTKNIVVTKKY